MKKLKIKLKSRERRSLVIGGVVFTLLGLFWYFYLWDNSLWAKYEKLKVDVQIREDMLRDMLIKERQVAAVRSRIARVLSRMPVREQAAPMDEFLDRIVKEKAPSAEFPGMKPMPPDIVQNLYRVNSAEVKLVKLPLEELVDLLFSIESAPGGFKVRQLDITTEKEDPDLLELKFLVVSGSPLKPEKPGANASP